MSARTSGTSQWPLHVVLLGGLGLCTLGFLIELKRGMGGHLPAWAYVFEWPLFGTVGLIMWWRLLHESDDSDSALPHVPEDPTVQLATAPDVQLSEWNAYVARLQAGKPDR